ncbi:related to translocation protein sec62 [Sporisorium scitamineum]|uniref:Translocation protein SEC62 n=1 Tax=Sporisorium scitamineum TaxID=49012 RepID=A0A0F7RX26_9BASI|nr:hypothetical protein [Sporisorium scitamineum]CDU22856.1 related to translocation protein sec62 [Sporisorium scitamineum]
MTKARRRNLRASAAPPLSSTHRQHQKPLALPKHKPESEATGVLDCVEVDADAHEQLDLKSFIDMASHSAELTSSSLTRPPPPRKSSCCPALDDDNAVSYVSQEQQSSAPLPARNVVNFLRNKSGIKTRVGALNGKRVDYFKGSAAVKALLSPAYAKLKDVPKVTSKEEAEECLHNIIPFAFFLRVERGASTGGKDSPKVVEINPQQMFKSDLYYVWLYEGSQLGLKLAGLGMVAVMLAGVMFPLWPPTMRLGVWYLSVAVLGLIGLFFGIAIVRLIFWLITVVVVKPGIWIFPNLFEDVGFVDSFIPLWAWDVPPLAKKKSGKAAGAGEGGKKKVGAAGAGAGAGARQQALSGVGGVPPTTVQQPKQAPRATESKPAEPSSTQSTGSGGPGASDSLDDIN